MKKFKSEKVYQFSLTGDEMRVLMVMFYKVSDCLGRHKTEHSTKLRDLFEPVQNKIIIQSLQEKTK